MSTFTCPAEPLQTWFPLDPNIVELPVAPEVTENPNPVPANTYSEPVTDEDFEFIELDWLSLSSPTCFTEDWGLCTAEVEEEIDYGSLLTIWDLLPTDSPAVPELEISFDIVYPPYREITTQSFPVVLSGEYVRVDKRKFTLDLDAFTVFTRVGVSKPLLRNVFASVRLVNDTATLGGSLALPVRLAVNVTSEPAALRIGFATGFFAWREGTPEPQEFQVIDAVLRLKADYSVGSYNLDLPVTLVADVESGDSFGMAFGVEVI
jgi:hypothetical protein